MAVSITESGTSVAAVAQSQARVEVSAFWSHLGTREIFQAFGYHFTNGTKGCVTNRMTQISTNSRLHSSLCPVRISAEASVVLTEVSTSPPQTFQANADHRTSRMW